jgi:hypothetical protein
MIGEIHKSNSSHKTGFTVEDCPFFINMLKVLSTNNLRLFLNTLPHVHTGIFSDPYHGISNVGSICHIVGSDTIIKFMYLTYHIKPILNSIKF